MKKVKISTFLGEIAIFLRFALLGGAFGRNGHHHVFRAGADAELAAPDAHARADVVAGAAPLPRAVGTFIDAVGNPADGPHLPVVGVPRELEVDARLLGLLQAVGLVVEQDGEALLVDVAAQLVQALARAVGAVVATDDLQP